MGRKSAFIPELPCEKLVRRICGNGWRNLPGQELDGAWGVAIVNTILRGVPPKIGQVAYQLGVDKSNISSAFYRLSQNGCMTRGADKIMEDKSSLEDPHDDLVWYYYAGFAAGATGLIDVKS